MLNLNKEPFLSFLSLINTTMRTYGETLVSIDIELTQEELSYLIMLLKGTYPNHKVYVNSISDYIWQFAIRPK